MILTEVPHAHDARGDWADAGCRCDAGGGADGDTPAPNPKCKDAVTAQARSTAQLSDATREKRAQEKAICNWGKRARDTYGWQYRFWTKAEDKQVNCSGTAKSKTCTVSAKPCKVL